MVTSWSIWKENIQIILTIIGIVAVIFACGFLGWIGWQETHAVQVAHCRITTVKMVDHFKGFPYQWERELVYETPDGDVAAFFLEPGYEVGKILDCKEPTATFTMKAPSGIWSTYEVCVGEQCLDAERHPHRVNVG